MNSTLAAARTDLDLARYEPVSIRASDDWLNTRREAAEQSRSLCTLLLLLGKDPDETPRRHIGERLAALSARLAAHDESKSGAASAPAAAAHSLVLSGRIEEALAHLEETLRSPAGNTRANAHARP